MRAALARRAAITQRSRNYLVFFREEDPSRPGEFLYGMRRFRERVGYDGEAQFLLPGVQFDLPTGSISATLPPGASTHLLGVPIPLFDGLPDETNEDIYGANRRPKTTPGSSGWFRPSCNYRRRGMSAASERWGRCSEGSRSDSGKCRR